MVFVKRGDVAVSVVAVVEATRNAARACGSLELEACSVWSLLLLVAVFGGGGDARMVDVRECQRVECMGYSSRKVFLVFLD